MSEISRRRTWKGAAFRTTERDLHLLGQHLGAMGNQMCTWAALHMTPLAKEAAELSVREKTWWRNHDYHRLLAPFPADVKCFEMSQVRELALGLAEDAKRRGNIAEAMAFLPAPATWIEYRGDDGTLPGGGRCSTRGGFFFSQKANGTALSVALTGLEFHGGISFIAQPRADLPLLSAADPDGWALDSTLVAQQLGEAERKPDAAWVDTSRVDWDKLLIVQQAEAYKIYALLSLINSPKIVHRSERKTPSGFTKWLARKAGKPYQLLPWHEIYLDVAPSPEMAAAVGPSRLTGPRALHFCRQFIRIRLGRLEYLRAHWRGDASVGIAQSRYTMRN